MEQGLLKLKGNSLLHRGREKHPIGDIKLLLLLQWAKFCFKWHS